MKKRILILIFLVLFLLPSCAAGNAEESPEESASDLTPVAGAEETPEETEFDWYASLPEGTDFGGYTFTVVRYESETWDIYIAPEEMTGEVLNDAAYKRTLEAEDLIDIKVEELRDGNYEGDFKNVVKAGESETYDLICFWCPGERASYITGNLVYDWQDLGGLDLDARWYNQSANRTYHLGSKQYFAVSDLTFPVQQHFRILFNKELAVQLGLDYPYEAVYNGQWTFDKMLGYSKDAYADLNGNGQADKDDRYGMAMNAAYIAGFGFNFGELPMTWDEEGYHFNLVSDRIVRIVELMQGLRSNPDVFFATSGNDHYKVFEAGNALFEGYGSDPVLLRDLEFDFGYLPYPKLDESDDYTIWTVGGMMAVPITLSDPLRTGTVIEVLSAGSNKYVVDAFIEQYVEGKILRDEDSKNIYRMMREKAICDLSYNVDPSGMLGEYKYFSKFVNDLNASPASYSASISKVLNKNYEKMMNQINGN
jgi:ABC-type glycerol-3-phosphate transport system substrate-binding protein